MRINKLIQIGRFEGYIGSRPHWSPEWGTFPTRHGYDLRAGHWIIIVEWLPKPKSREQILAELLARAQDALEDRHTPPAEDAQEWPSRASP